MKPIVCVQQVSKRYSKNANMHLSYGLTDLYRALFGTVGDRPLREDEFMAVSNVSFYLNPGDSLALIGRNGSGKTTLLKAMNGLIKPDAGVITVEGRVQALINLGAGFNPALSGKDNIFNSASLMGYSRKDTQTILEDIVDFAELEEFIDSPVGTYSSGMKARLGFSVAINLNPDILLIDEILSVGDQAFRNKCFVRLHQLKKDGVTLVLVSHSPTHVIQLCEKALWLHKGEMMKLGPAKETVQAYTDFLDGIEADKVRELNILRENSAKSHEIKSNEALARRESGESLYGPVYDEQDRVKDLSVTLSVDNNETHTFHVHDELCIDYSFTLLGKVTDLNVTLSFYTEDGLRLSVLSTLNGDLLRHIHQGEVRCSVKIPDFNLAPGTYVLVMPIHEGKSYLYRDIVKKFVVTGRDQMSWGLTDFQYEYEVGATGDATKRVNSPQ
jgi:ABC-type polysaccharide/polyol phosphate transport system ATPase subunit